MKVFLSLLPEPNFYLRYPISERINLRQQSIFEIYLKSFYEDLRTFLNLKESFRNFQNSLTERRSYHRIAFFTESKTILFGSSRCGIVRSFQRNQLPNVKLRLERDKYIL